MDNLAANKHILIVFPIEAVQLSPAVLHAKQRLQLQIPIINKVQEGSLFHLSWSYLWKKKTK